MVVVTVPRHLRRCLHHRIQEETTSQSIFLLKDLDWQTKQSKCTSGLPWTPMAILLHWQWAWLSLFFLESCRVSSHSQMVARRERWYSLCRSLISVEKIGCRSHQNNPDTYLSQLQTNQSQTRAVAASCRLSFLR